MYACICHKITEKELEETVQATKGNLNDALRKLNLGQSCGVCLMDALEKVGMQMASKDSNIAKKN
ncbi:MAG: (2Fe-2S)-binding protein [Bdellovibrionota bacterium]|jgi:bacterioferritin-associated ferredoxin|nr:(2Fe-2S)-binding protein [Bdellovibrionota bacterium]